MSQATHVRAVLVASCASENGDGAGPSPCSALVPLAGKCALTYWLDIFKGCSRLQPLADKVVVMCHPAHQQQLASWAAAVGLPSSCIVSTSSSASSLGLVQGVAAAAAACPHLAGCYVLAADAGYVLEPGCSLSRLVEAAVVRGKDTVTSIVPFEGADLSQLVQVHKQDLSLESSRVSAIEAAAEGLADGCCHTTLGPVCVLSPGTLTSLAAAAGAVTDIQAGSLKQLGYLLQQQLMEQGKPVYSVDIPFYFSLSSEEDCALTDAFFGHYKELRRIATREVQQLAVGVEGAAAAKITGTLDSLMSKLETLGARQPPSPTRQQLAATVNPNKAGRSPTASLSSTGFSSSHGSSSGSSGGNKGGSSSSSLKHMFVEFFSKYQVHLAQQAKVAVSRDYSTLPARFDHPEGWEMRTKQQHPCYITTNNEYGAKRPTGFDMPLVWTGIQGKFTDTFHGGCYRSMGLKTSVERSRVHRALDNL